MCYTIWLDQIPAIDILIKIHRKTLWLSVGEYFWLFHCTLFNTSMLNDYRENNTYLYMSEHTGTSMAKFIAR